MKYSISHIGVLLKNARLQKKLSQRALSVKAHIPQSHISKIESGVVDLHVSSLIELSRLLGLELMLVPQNLLSTIKALEANLNKGNKSQKSIPAYQIESEDEDDDV